MNKGIIEFIYSEKDCEHIRSLYKDDSLKLIIQKAIGQKIINLDKQVIDGKALDLLSLICLNQNFTDDEAECFAVAIFICRGITSMKPLVRISENRGLDLASKTLVALSFFKPALVARCNRYGAPTPEYYRKLSQNEFTKNGFENIAQHHQCWEGFLNEHLI